MRVLADIGDAAVKVLLTQIPEIDAAQGYPTGGGVDQPEGELGKGRFSRTARSQQHCGTPCRQVEPDVVEHRPAIAEGHTFEPQIEPFRERGRVLWIADARLHVRDLKQAARGGPRAAQKLV